MSNWIDKDGRRHVGVMVGGKRVHRILPEGATAGDAKLAESAIRASIGNGRVVNIPGDPPLASVMGLYIEHAKNLRSSDTAIHHANRLGPWVSMYRASQVRECAAHIVKDMTTKAVQADGTLRAPYTAATVNRSLGTLKKALAIAWERNITSENYGLRIKRLPEKNQREVFLSVDEVRRIAQHCTEPVQAAIWCALLTGARRGEVCKIEAQHIHADHIEIPATHTKTLKVRAVPIVPALRPWLHHFPLPVSFEGIKTAWQRARVAEGMEHVNFHDLRHSCASILIGLGVDLYTVGEILGHTSIQTTKRYAHLQMARKADALGMLGKLVTPEPRKLRVV